MALQTPPLPARVYQGVTWGPGTSKTYQVQPGVPIDGTRQVLRHPEVGSPFTFRILPPDVLLGAMNGTQEQTEDISIVGAAQRIYNDFPAYLSKIETFRSNPLVFKGNEDRTRLASLVANNGVQFDPADGSTSMANVLGIADVQQALSVIGQLNDILATPPLTLLVNPQTLSVTRQKKQTYTDRNRYGYIFQAWGEEQVRLSVSARTGAFIAGTRFTDSDAPQNFRGLGASSRGRVSDTSAASGLQYANKIDSASWQNFQALMSFYRNNGYLYNVIEKSEAHWWHGMIAIDYDQWTYLGHFENFTYNLTEQNQNGGVDFSFEFICSFVIDNAQRELQVLPIHAPTPSPSDPLWSFGRGTNRNFGLRGRQSNAPRNDPPMAQIPDPASMAAMMGR